MSQVHYQIVCLAWFDPQNEPRGINFKGPKKGHSSEGRAKVD
jgi:hypothetical protein